MIESVNRFGSIEANDNFFFQASTSSIFYGELSLGICSVQLLLTANMKATIGKRVYDLGCLFFNNDNYFIICNGCL